MSPHAAQQEKIAAFRGATEQEHTPLLCTIFPFLLRPPRSPPLCLFVYVCFWWAVDVEPIWLISSAERQERKPAADTPFWHVEQLRADAPRLFQLARQHFESVSAQDWGKQMRELHFLMCQPFSTRQSCVQPQYNWARECKKNGVWGLD